MRLHRFFIEEQLRNKKSVSFFEDELIHQWKDVFRFGQGDRLILLDNSRYEFLVEIETLTTNKAELKIIQETKSENMPRQDMWLFAALIKKDNYEWVLEKGTELGVSHFVPIISERSEKKGLNMERAKKIVREASEQSGRAILPEVFDPVKIEEALKIAENNPVSLIALHPSGEKFSQEKLTPDTKKFSSLGINDADNKSIGVFIGPEGGWSEREIEFFTAHNIKIFSLGTQILRAETAAIAIASLLLL